MIVNRNGLEKFVGVPVPVVIELVVSETCLLYVLHGDISKTCLLYVVHMWYVIKCGILRNDIIKRPVYLNSKYIA